MPDARLYRAGETVQLPRMSLELEKDVPVPVAIGVPAEAANAPDSVLTAAPRERERFTDEGAIAFGGRGAVHAVVDNTLLRRVAMKRLRPGTDSAIALRFLEEAQVTGQLDHPNIVPVYEVGEDADGAQSYFTMKLVRGRTLSELLAELGERRLEVDNLEQLIHIMLKVCDAVAFAHSRLVVHRDLKPDNLMVGSYGQVYVMDWGLARLLAMPPNPDEAQLVLGTPAYMAPEQAQSDLFPIDIRTDVYALGGILYRILTDRPPHVGESAMDAILQSIAGTITPPEELLPNTPLPPELCRIALRALSFDPADRYESVEALRADLERLLKGGGWLDTRAYPAGSLIVREGDDAHEAFVIEQGHCEAYKGEDGDRVAVRAMGPGEVFGETAVLTAKKRTASVRAVDEVTVKIVTRESLERELSRSGWMKSFVSALAERFREIDDRLTEVERRG